VCHRADFQGPPLLGAINRNEIVEHRVFLTCYFEAGSKKIDFGTVAIWLVCRYGVLLPLFEEPLRDSVTEQDDNHRLRVVDG
jgi:hypothetical protein